MCSHVLYSELAGRVRRREKAPSQYIFYSFSYFPSRSSSLSSIPIPLIAHPISLCLLVKHWKTFLRPGKQRPRQPHLGRSVCWGLSACSQVCSGLVYTCAYLRVKCSQQKCHRGNWINCIREESGIFWWLNYINAVVDNLGARKPLNKSLSASLRLSYIIYFS